MGGVSQSRNTVIADIFYRLELIKSYGTGIKRILESYQGAQVQPVFAPAPASFVVTLPNISERGLEKYAALTDTDKVMRLFESAAAITRKDVERALNASSFPATNALNKLLREGKLIRVGSAKATKYMLNRE